MSEFRNVSVVKKANVYFDGKVVSRTVLFPDGSKKTLGVMQPGEYEFNTGDKEIMEIMSGELDVLLPGTNTWKPVKGGESFEVLPDRVTILAQLAERPEDIDRERAERARRRAEERLAKPTMEVDFERARIALMKSMVRLQVAARARTRA